jgi:hypothetical protein
MKNTLLLLCLLAATFIACKKDPKPAVEEDEALVVFDKGVPVGTPVTKSIGPEGGVIAMPDGRISVSVPAGAVKAATLFSIQPVTSTLPLSCDSINYKLTPENLRFDKPVTIRFNYSENDIDGSAPELLSIGYQDAAGHWFGKDATALDSIHRTLTVNSYHFSTWGSYRLFAIGGGKDAVTESEKSYYNIMYVNSSQPIQEAEFDDVMTPIVSPKEFNTSKDVSGWKVHGQGTLEPSGDKSKAVYTAPSSIKKKSTVTVEVTLSNLFDKVDPTRPGRSGKMILLKPLDLVPAQFEFYVDGKKAALTDIRFSSNGANMVINGKNGVNEMQVTINGLGRGNYGYAFPSGSIPAGKAVIYYGPNSGERYLCGTIKCVNGVPEGTMVSPGVVSIYDWGKVGEVVSGDFQATLYRFDPSKPQDPCAVQSISIKADFSMKRK